MKILLQLMKLVRKDLEDHGHGPFEKSSVASAKAWASEWNRGDGNTVWIRPIIDCGLATSCLARYEQDREAKTCEDCNGFGYPRAAGSLFRACGTTIS